jgi:2'-5' RNA ligase
MSIKDRMDLLIEVMENKHTFVLLPVPEELASLWPKNRGGGDTTPPHFTLLFIGEYDQKKKPELLKLVGGIARETPPFRIRLEPGVAWFTSHDEKLDHREIAHKKPDTGSSAAMARLHQRLRTEIEDFLGHEVKHFKGPFKAHSTLRYEPKRSYNGEVPEGAWEANVLAVMDGTRRYNFPLQG